jgi:ubiquinol-cytochrome c reductase iron-sulfur subunit
MNENHVDGKRRRLLTLATSGVGLVGVGAIAVPFLGSMNPSERAKAAGAPVEVDIGKMEEGQLLTVEWRGKPVWIIRRSAKSLELLTTIEDRLADPSSKKEQQPEYAKNMNRSIKDEYIILVGICTHLGCAPGYRPDIGAVDFDNDWKGGFLCACHGSKFDLAGRVYKNVPAPTNLEVPPHKYLSDTRIIIGVDTEATT